MKRLRTVILLPALLALLFISCESLDFLIEDVTGPRPLDEQTIIAGLIEALEIGSRNSVDRGSAFDGFWGNPVLRIPLPAELVEVDRRLRQIGLGRQMDDFIERMSRAAEVASGEATEVLVGAVRAMTFDDARSILRGEDDAATRFFERTTRAELATRFHPIVTTAMDETGLTPLFRFVIDSYNRLPFVAPATFDIDAYVVDKTLDGLFVLLAEEELLIRTDPVARVTDLLRRVFGSREQGRTQ